MRISGFYLERFPLRFVADCGLKGSSQARYWAGELITWCAEGLSITFFALRLWAVTPIPSLKIDGASELCCACRASWALK
jgi:hypothetical protein